MLTRRVWAVVVIIVTEVINLTVHLTLVLVVPSRLI